jgi:hypothetical protein
LIRSAIRYEPAPRDLGREGGFEPGTFGVQGLNASNGIHMVVVVVVVVVVVEVVVVVVVVVVVEVVVVAAAAVVVVVVAV